MDWPERRSGNEVVLAGGWRDAAWSTRRGPEADRFRALRGLALQPDRTGAMDGITGAKNLSIFIITPV
jgi:hypothetical protein